MMKILSLVFALQCALAAPAMPATSVDDIPDIPFKNIFVGNAGEGVVLGDQIVLLDLFENQVTDLYFGPVDPKVLARAEEDYDIWRDLNVSAAKVAAKISDLNRMRPHLGDLVLKELEWHFWFVTEFTDLPSWGEYEATPITGDFKVVRLATRSDMIYVDSKAMLKMNEDQRVALIFHEALYSLVKTRMLDGFPTQISKDVRDIVAMLFKEGCDKNAILKEVLSERLFIPSMAEVEKPALTIQMSNDLETLQISGHEITSTMRTAFNNLCFQASPNTDQTKHLQMQKKIRDQEMSDYTYVSKFGERKAVRVDMVEKVQSSSIIVNGEDCVQKMNSFLDTSLP